MKMETSWMCRDNQCARPWSRLDAFKAEWPASVLVTLNPASTPKRISTWTCTRKDECGLSLPGRNRAVCDISHLASLWFLPVLRLFSWAPSTLMLFPHDLVSERAHSSILPLVTAGCFRCLAVRRNATWTSLVFALLSPLFSAWWSLVWDCNPDGCSHRRS